MPECHNCPYRGTDRCLTCVAPKTPSGGGQNWVSIDSGSSQTAAEVEASMARFRRSSEEEEEYEYDERSVAFGERMGALRVLQYFMGLDPGEVSLLLMALVQPLAQTARDCGQTRAAISARWRKLVKAHPELEEIIHPAPRRRAD